MGGRSAPIGSSLLCFFLSSPEGEAKTVPRLAPSKLQHLGILAVIVIMKMRNVADIFSRAAVK